MNLDRSQKSVQHCFTMHYSYVIHFILTHRGHCFDVQRPSTWPTSVWTLFPSPIDSSRFLYQSLKSPFISPHHLFKQLDTLVWKPTHCYQINSSFLRVFIFLRFRLQRLKSKSTLFMYIVQCLIHTSDCTLKYAFAWGPLMVPSGHAWTCKPGNGNSKLTW